MTTETPASPTPRRIATPRWLDLRLVLGVVLVVGSVLVGAAVVSSASDTRPVVAVRRDLAAGTVLGADDLEVRQVQLDDPAADRYLDTTRGLAGRRLARDVGSGELLPRAALGSDGGARTTVTVSLAAGAAPQLRKGQRIELWLSTPTCAFVVLLPDVTVQSVRGDDGSFTSGQGGQSVVIGIDPALASRVVGAQSIRDAQVRAGVLAPGSRPSGAPASGAAPAPSAVPGAPAGLPADLAACAGTSGSR